MRTARVRRHPSRSRRERARRRGSPRVRRTRRVRRSSCRTRSRARDAGSWPSSGAALPANVAKKPESPVYRAIWVTTSRTWRCRRDDPLRDALAKRRDVAVDRERAGALRRVDDDRPVVGCRGGHEVEHRADVLRRRRDDIQVAQVPLGVVQLEVELELSGEVELGDHVDVVGGHGRRRVPRVCCVPLPRRVPGRRGCSRRIGRCTRTVRCRWRRRARARRECRPMRLRSCRSAWGCVMRQSCFEPRDRHRRRAKR